MDTVKPLGKRLRWWSPLVIRRGVGSQMLPCGCVVGVYERFNGMIVGVIDDCGRLCQDHAAGRAYALAS
jgi:hypothetical protein